MSRTAFIFLLALAVVGCGSLVMNQPALLSGTGTGSGTGPQVPANAVRVDGIQLLPWEAEHDSGATGSAIGTTALVQSPSRSGSARQFVSDYTNYGGERFHASFGQDTGATHFLYDGWVYLNSSVSSIANLELDTNQVVSSGDTVIYGFQCEGRAGTWDYTENAGTPNQYADRWVSSSQACNVRNWTLNTWHHVQVLYYRDAAGNVTYQSVWLDGAEQDIDKTVPSAFALGWGSTLLTNFQIDGRDPAGSAIVYLDELTIYRW